MGFNKLLETATKSAVINDPMVKIIRSLPKECFQPSVARSTAYLLRDLTLGVVAVTLIITTHSWLWGLLPSIMLGAALSGMFVIGHDAGHRSFCRSKKWNNVIGHFSTSAVFWPFHVWRLDHDAHHRHTNHIDKDPAWRPVTFKIWQRIPARQRLIYLWTRSGFFFLGSFYTTWMQIKGGLRARSSTRLSDQEKREVLFSVWLTFGVVGIYLTASMYFASWYGFVYLFVLPQVLFHFLLSTFTYFHHTSPHSHFLSRKEWTQEQAQLLGTLHVGFPRLLEHVVHDINWHVPHHVCVGIPHYQLRKAHAALRARYSDVIHESTFGWKLVKDVTSKCHFIVSRNPGAPDLSWVSYDEKMREVARNRKVTAPNQDFPRTYE